MKSTIIVKKGGLIYSSIIAKYIIVLLFIGLTFSCSDHRGKDDLSTSDTVVLDIDHRDSRTIESSAVEKVEIIIPEMDDEFLLGDFDKVLFRDDKLFVKPANRGKLFLFSTDGEGLSIIDNVGAGPGEYLQLTDFDVDTLNRQIIILDAGNRKMLHYSYDGELLTEKPFDLYIKLLKAYYADGEVNYIVDLGSSKLLPGQSTSYSINIFSNTWEFLRGYFEFSKPQVGMIGDIYMLFNKSGGTTGYYKPFTDGIYHFEDDGMFQAYKLKFQLPVMPYEIFEADPYGSHAMNGHTYNIVYDENDDLLFIEYLHEGQTYFVVYYKIENKMEHFTFPKVRGDCTMRVFQNILGLNGSGLVVQVAPSELPCIREVFAPVLDDSQVQILDQIGEYDNNFLLLIQLK